MRGYSKREHSKGEDFGHSCPALGSTITTETCASQRGSHIDCPPDCPSNPFGFANYQKFRDLEGRWFDKAIERVKEVMHSLPRLASKPAHYDPLHEMMEVQWVMLGLLGRGPL